MTTSALIVVLFATVVHPSVALVAGGALACGLAFLINETLMTRRRRALIDGMYGEQFTSDAVRKLRRRGWRIVDRVVFEHDDVDHVVIGPGGAFAIETKWTNTAWSIENGTLSTVWARKAAAQCRRNRHRIHWLLRGNAGVHLEVTALLVVWGEGRPRLDEPTLVDGVVVLDGQMLRPFLQRLPSQLPSGTIAEAASGIETFVQQRERHDAALRRVGRHPQDASVRR